MTEYSGLAGGMMSSRFNSRSALRQHVRRRFGFFESRAQERDLFVGAGVAFAQFALDGFQLSAQIGPALGVAKLRLHILLRLC